MKALNIEQNTQEWLDVRMQYHCASEASIIMAASNNVSRNELIRLKATGDSVEFNDWVQKNIIDYGHEVEELARPIAEHILGADLFPVVGVDETDYLLSSFDGITMDGSTTFECKQWNNSKAETVIQGEVPEEDLWQVVQQLVVSGAEKCLYMVTDGTDDKTVYCFATLAAGQKETLLAAWKQFDEDVSNYTPKEEYIPATGSPVADLPAVSVQVSGQISIIDNFNTFELAIRDFVDNKLIKDPSTDQDFADLTLQIKTLEKAENSLKAVESYMLSQVASIDAAKRMKDMLYELARSNRLSSEKLLESKKKEIRNNIMQSGREAFSEHISRINKTFSNGVTLPVIPVDFANAMKGKKTITSLQNAVDDELARAKIEANKIADHIRINLDILKTEAKDYEMLFADTQQIILKEKEDLQNIIKLRISEHKKAEKEKEERIREDERIKAQKKQEPEATEHVPNVKPVFETVPAPEVIEINNRPTNEQIVSVLCNYFRVDKSIALQWIVELAEESKGTKDWLDGYEKGAKKIAKS